MTHHIKRLPICPICDAPIENPYTHRHVEKTETDHFADAIKEVHRLGWDAVVIGSATVSAGSGATPTLITSQSAPPEDEQTDQARSETEPSTSRGGKS